MNSTILRMLRQLPENNKSHWKDHINKVLFAYNCTRHDSTGYSPHYLLFGRKPRLPVDLILQTQHNETTNHSHEEYLKQWRSQMAEAFTIAKQKSDSRKEKDAVRRANRPTLQPLRAGDRVLIKNLSERGGTGKIRSFWEDNIHLIVEPIGDSSVVYKFKPEKGSGRTRIVHRNILLPCDTLLDPLPPPVTRPNAKKQRNITHRHHHVGGGGDMEEDEVVTTDEEICRVYTYTDQQFTYHER